MIERSTWLVDGHAAEPDPAWTLEWVNRAAGEGVLRRGGERIPVLVEGGPATWQITIGGRRITVEAFGRRERLLAQAAKGAGRAHRPTEVRAALPGLVVGIAVEVGDDVADGAPLLTMEAMKMQNEIRAPRAGRVVRVWVQPGQTVAAGAPLVQLADSEP